MRSKKAIKNIITSILLQVTNVICGFIVPRLLITNFGSNINGLIASITQFLGYIMLLEAGIGPVVKAALYKPIVKGDKSKIADILKASERFFRKIIYIFLVYLLVLCVLFPNIVSDEFDALFTISLILIISISTFAEYYFGMIYRLYLQAEQKTYITSMIQIGALILNTIATVVLIKSGVNIQIVKLVSAIIFLIRPILQNIYVKKKYNMNLKDADTGYKLKQKWEGLAQHIAAVIHNNTAIVILTIFTNTIEISIYSVYLLVVTGIKKIIQAFTDGVDASFGNMIANNEKEHLRKSFRIYELFYFTIMSVAFSATLLLILPFVEVYTHGVEDTNYYRPLFGYLLVLAEFTHAIRLPYSSLVLAIGHFKNTRVGAWIEAGVNIVISVILVNRYGLVGVAIGTLVAMIIRTIELIIYTSKHILERSILYSFKRVVILMLEVIIIGIISQIIPQLRVDSYVSWALYASIIFTLSFFVIVTINSILYIDDLKELIKIIKKNINSFKKVKNNVREEGKK